MDAGDNHIGFIDGQGEPRKARNKTFKDTQLVEDSSQGPAPVSWMHLLLSFGKAAMWFHEFIT